MVATCRPSHPLILELNTWIKAVHSKSTTISFRQPTPVFRTCVKRPIGVQKSHEDFHKGNVKIELVKKAGRVDAPLTAPIRPSIPTPDLVKRLEVVIRTLKLGHLFTQGTADSNQVWMDVQVRDEEGVLGRSGSMDESQRVDPWSPL